MTLLITDAVPRGLGYLEVDQRNVPEALPPGVQRYMEADTYTCSHCQFVVILNPARTRERYKCKGCNHHICDKCTAARVAGGPCRTMTQVIDEKLERALRQPESNLIILP